MIHKIQAIMKSIFNVIRQERQFVEPKFIGIDWAAGASHHDNFYLFPDGSVRDSLEQDPFQVVVTQYPITQNLNTKM